MSFKALKLSVVPVTFMVLAASAQTDQYRVAPAAKWVKEHEADPNISLDTACVQGGEEYLLLDRQHHLGSRQGYWHRVTRLATHEAVQNGARFETSFDPTYQRLTIHHLRIVRNGVIIDKLERSRIKVLRREEDMSSYMYDGSLTVIVEMTDIRVGDIVDEALTIEGWNPVDEGRFHRHVGMGFSIPIGRCYTRMVVPVGREPRIAHHGDVVRPNVEMIDAGTEHVWDVSPLNCVQADDGAPRWYDAYPWMEISEFKDVEELRSWALKQYAGPHQLGPDLEQRLGTLRMLPSVGERLDSALGLVQREIRYLGLEEGMGAYRPHPPRMIYEQRFGDCKDKSLLLCTILKELGVTAYPALVSTTAGIKLDTWLPRPSQFDHCIAMVISGSDTIWADATSSYNGGRGKHRYTPDYGKALLIAPGVRGYTSLSVNDTGFVDVLEHITLDSIGGTGNLTIRSEFGGGRADAVRAEYASRSTTDLNRSYTDYYTGLYGPCEMLEPVRVEDDRTKNVFVVHEHYRLLQPWDTIDDGTRLRFDLNATYVRDYQTDPGEVLRTSPLALGEPTKVHHRFRVELPVAWEVDTSGAQFQGQGVSFVRSIRVEDGRVVVLDHGYSTTLDHVEAIESSSLHDLQKKIADQLYFEFTHPIGELTEEEDDMAWGKWLFIGTCIALSIFGALRLYRYDPDPHPDALAGSGRPIGGFLILPALGLCVSILGHLIEMFKDDAWFFHMTGSSWTLSTPFPVLADIYTHLSQANGIFCLALVCLLIVLFFKRRTSVPLLMKVLYAWSVLWLFMDVSLYNILEVDDLTGENYDGKELTRAFIAACVWIPVFQFSSRVRETFTRRLGVPVVKAFPEALQAERRSE